MKKWGSEKVYTDDEMKKYSGELWVTLQTYEEELRKEMKGHQIIFNKTV